MKHWQHATPLDCPRGHAMLWLGSRFWMCPPCGAVYVEGRAHE